MGLEDMIRTVADICPKTCGTCENVKADAAGKHLVHLLSNGTKLRKRTCAQMATNPSSWCTRKLEDMIRTVADICPKTCGTCENVKTDAAGKHGVHLLSNGTKLRVRTCAQMAKN